MELIIMILLDFLGLKDSRKNALKLKKLKIDTKKNTSFFEYQIENTFKDYLTVLFPIGELNSTELGNLNWDLLETKNTDDNFYFEASHKTSLKPKKMKLKQEFAEVFPSLVLKPHSKIRLFISTNNHVPKQKLKFEVAFRIKKLNSKIHIKQVKM